MSARNSLKVASETFPTDTPFFPALWHWLTTTKYGSYALDVLCMLLLALIAGEYALNYDITLQAIPHDTTYHIYAAQQILDGHAIYRDVAIIKAPLADFATAFALVAARIIGISDIMGARLMSLLVAMATTSVTYLAGRVLFRSRAVGLLAGLLMAGWDFYGLRAITGPEPKAFLILFGMLAFIGIARRRWVFAGICAALATLSWQPGLMVAAIACAAALLAPWLDAPNSSFRDVWREGIKSLLRVLGGIALPFALVIIYLGLNNALIPAWNATIGANVVHFANTQASTPLPQLVRANFADILADGGQYCFSPLEHQLIYASILGFGGILIAQFVNARRSKRALLNLDQTPLILYTIGFVGFSFVDFDFCPDLFPLLPVMALSVGWGIWMLAHAAGRFAERRMHFAHASTLSAILIAAAALWIVAVYLLDVRAYTVRGMNFQDQMDVVEVAKTYLKPGDRVLTFGNAIVLVELHLPNAVKIVHLGSKSGLGVLASEPGGMDGMLAALDRNPPKLITLARENFPEFSKPFYDWLAQHYDPVEEFPRANMRFFLKRQ